MKKEYEEASNKYPSSIIFVRVGDYYETYNSASILVSRTLGLTLTSRTFSEIESVNMCGIPCHSFDRRLTELLKHGYSVIVLDNSHDPKDPNNKLVVTKVEGL